MQTKWAWFERKFNFDFPAEKLGEIFERLLGTSARIEAAVNGLDETLLTKPETVAPGQSSKTLGIWCVWSRCGCRDSMTSLADSKPCVKQT